MTKPYTTTSDFDPIAGSPCFDSVCPGHYWWERVEEFRQHQILTCDRCGDTVGEMEPV